MTTGAGASGDAAADLTPLSRSARAPVFRWIYEHNGLAKLAALLRSSVDTAEHQVRFDATSDACVSGAQMWEFMRNLEALLPVPCFTSSFTDSPDCQALLFQGLGVGPTGPQPDREAVFFPAAALVQPLEEAFNKSAAITERFVGVIVKSGGMDCLLLQLGELQSVRPRNEEYVLPFEDPVKVNHYTCTHTHTHTCLSHPPAHTSARTLLTG